MAVRGSWWRASRDLELVERVIQAVVAVDEEPEHAAVLEVTVAEGHRQVLAAEGEVDHRRIFPITSSHGPRWQQ